MRDVEKSQFCIYSVLNNIFQLVSHCTLSTLSLLVGLTHKVSRPELCHEGHDHFTLHFDDVLGGQKHTRADLARAGNRVFCVQHLVLLVVRGPVTK